MSSTSGHLFLRCNSCRLLACGWLVVGLWLTRQLVCVLVYIVLEMTVIYCMMCAPRSAKIPPWMMCGTRFDVLRRMRRPVLGMTSPQMYIKVAGVWTAAHEENNRFRSINCSHGPGVNHWGGVDARHAMRLRELVLKHHGVDIYKSESTWLPDLAFLVQHEIPVMVGDQVCCWVL